MDERSWWSDYVRPALHRPAERCIAEKVQDAFKKGAPDVDCCSRGVVLKLELKFLKEFPTPHRDPNLPLSFGLSTEQGLWLDAWYSAGGNAGVLIGIADGHALYSSWSHVKKALPAADFIASCHVYTWKTPKNLRGPACDLAWFPRHLAIGLLF